MSELVPVDFYVKTRVKRRCIDSSDYWLRRSLNQTGGYLQDPCGLATDKAM